MKNTIDATDTTFTQEVEQNPGVTIVDFWATWCGPCRMIAPIMEQIATERAGEVKVVKVDISENTGVAARYNVRSVPMLLFFKEGKVVGQIVGAVQRARIEATLQEHLAA